MECGLTEVIQPYNLCMWLLFLFMAALVAAALCRLFPPDKEAPAKLHEEDLKPKSKTEILGIIERITRGSNTPLSEELVDCCDKKGVSTFGPLSTTKEVRSKFIKSAGKK